jgi:four helix bundle protein
MQIRSAKEWVAYKKGYELAMRVFRLSKAFPAEERFALTSQIRRASRSVCLNLREAWAKRRYEAHFISKLTDVTAKTETDSCLDFALTAPISPPPSIASWLRSAPRSKLLGSMLLILKSGFKTECWFLPSDL